MSNAMLYPVVKEQKYGFINPQGELLVEPIYDFVGGFSEDRCIAAFKQNHKWGLLNDRGEVILYPQFSFINSFLGYLIPSDPDPNSEFQELTIAMIEEPGKKKRKKVKEVYINRAGELVSPFDISAS